jgi:type I restriction enzyme M protein
MSHYSRLTREQRYTLQATQRVIVADIEAEQALVSANRELITRFQQKIQTTLARMWGEAKAVSPEP